MFKILLMFCVCVSIACYSASLPNFEFPDVQDVIKNEFDVNLRQLKQEYSGKIRKLQEEAMNFTLSGRNFDLTENMKLLNKAFYARAEVMKDIHKQSMKMFDRRYHVKCIDCITDYFEEMFSDFCDILDDSENHGFNATTLSHTLTPLLNLNLTTPKPATNSILSEISQAFQSSPNNTEP